MLMPLILMFCTYHLSAQDKGDSDVIRSSFHIDFVKEREKAIAVFSDSINNYNGEKVPCFLYNECFDLNAPLWRGFHFTRSLRWQVLQKVNNKQALAMLLKTDRKKMDKRCTTLNKEKQEDYLPFIEKSFWQLIRKRYKELNNKVLN